MKWHLGCTCCVSSAIEGATRQHRGPVVRARADAPLQGSRAAAPWDWSRTTRSVVHGSGALCTAGWVDLNAREQDAALIDREQPHLVEQGQQIALPIHSKQHGHALHALPIDTQLATGRLSLDVIGVQGLALSTTAVNDGEHMQKLLDRRTVYGMDNVAADIWIAACAHRLQQRWRTVDPLVLEEVAGDLWRDERLRTLPPDAAAVAWLDPIEPPPF